MVNIQEMERMVRAIAAGEPKPSLDIERSALWDQLKAEVDDIKRRGGTVQLAFDIPFLDEDEQAKVLSGAAPIIEDKNETKAARNPRRGWF